MNPLRVIFYGTSDFAVPALQALAQDMRFRIITVVTQPDRPVGRHATLTPSPIKRAAKEMKMDVRAYESLKQETAYEDLKTIAADVAVVASFGQIIPQRILDLTKYGAVNIHGSLLPRFRGASPIAAAIREGETETGVTIMKMDAKMDHGPILALAKEPIRSDDTSTSLSERLALLGAKTLPDVLDGYVQGRLVPQEQDHAAATVIGLLSREDGNIDWTKRAEEIERLVRAYDPWPGTWASVEGKRLKVLKASVGSSTNLPAGARFEKDGFPYFACGNHTSLRLERVQLEGKPVMDAAAFLRGAQFFQTLQ